MAERVLGAEPLGEGVAENRRVGARGRLSPSITVHLSFKFMILLAGTIFLLALLFVSLLTYSVTQKQDADLQKSIVRITDTVLADGTDDLAFLDLAYYVTYAVYETESRTVLATNDSLLPLLDSDGKSRTYFAKDFFTDSDLHIRYLTRTIEADGKHLTVECAIDIANDSAAQMLSAVPKLVLFALIPVLVLSFALSFLISRKTIAAFKTLRADYDREKAFTSNVSHELKTPIAIIDGHANLLRRWGKDDPKQLSESIDAILQATETMSGIVTTLLDMSRLEQGSIIVEKTRFAAADFFARLADEFSALYPALHITISDSDSLVLETDEQKLHQIFTVILSNSVKFAGEQCKITLSARKNDGKTVLSATDDGTGFTPDVLPHVFERFYKGDAAHNRNVSGAGLGLSIAKTLSDAIGAEIYAENTQSGGARIVVQVK
ncbi:MAG: hypothetical protein IJP62_11775 [Treponema sp.]|nr:hypothetical protein [Treponema sp.]